YTAVTDLAVQASAIRLHSPLDVRRLRRVSSQGSLVRLWALQASNLRPPPCKSDRDRLTAYGVVTPSSVDLRFRVSSPNVVTSCPGWLWRVRLQRVCRRTRGRGKSLRLGVRRNGRAS